MTRPMIRWSIVMAFAVGAAAWGAGADLPGGNSTAWAAAANPEPATSPVPPSSDTHEEPAHRVLLLGATIYGAVAAPNAVYEIPWQEPFLLGKGAGELDRNFLMEIFKPVDREEFLKHASPSQDGPGTRATP